MIPKNHGHHLIGLLFFLSLLSLLLIFNQRLINLFFPDPFFLLSRQLQKPNITSSEKQKLISAYLEKTENTTQVLVGVSKNQINELNRQLKNKELSLEEKEKLILAKEQELKNRDWLLIILMIALGLMFLLLILNFYLDYRHLKNNSPPAS